MQEMKPEGRRRSAVGKKPEQGCLLVLGTIREHVLGLLLKGCCSMQIKKHQGQRLLGDVQARVKHSGVCLVQFQAARDRCSIICGLGASLMHPACLPVLGHVRAAV